MEYAIPNELPTFGNVSARLSPLAETILKRGNQLVAEQLARARALSTFGKAYLPEAAQTPPPADR